MKFNNYPELINHHGEHVKIDWAIEEKTEIPKRSSDKNVLLAYTDATEGNLEHIVKTNLTNLMHPIIANLIYPVGSVIMTMDKTFNPATQFGGTWEPWTDGYLKVDQNPNAATTGTYNITTDQLPSHTHANTVTNNIVTTPNYEHAHTFNITLRTGTGEKASEAESGGEGESTKTSSTMTTNKDTHNHAFKTNVTITNAATGGGQEFKPKYYAVIAWQRTA